MANKNYIVNLLQAVTDVVNGFVQKDRAVNLGSIWGSAQNYLDAQSEMDQLNSGEMGDMADHPWILDVYAEAGGAGIFVIYTRNDGKLYKMPVLVDDQSQISFGAEQEVVMDFAPVTTGRQLSIKRQADGKVRWFAMPACTAVLNRSGEIDSRALFDSFVDYVRRTGKYPEFDFFHLGSHLTLGIADFVARDGYSYIASGTFYDTPIARAAIDSLEKNPDFWGLSIAYLPTEEPEMIRSSEGIEVPVFNVGINRFISLLPENTAASILTSISTKGVARMNKNVKDALKVLAGDDKELFDQIVAQLGNVDRSAPDMISRDKKPATQSATATQTPVKREFSSEEIKTIIGSEEFQKILDEKVEARFAASTAPDGNEDDDEEPETEETATEDSAPALQEVDAVALAELREKKILDAIGVLRTEIAELKKTKDASVREVLEDLPAKVSRQTILRPRATRMPESVRSVANVSLAEIASQTLEAMEQKVA